MRRSLSGYDRRRAVAPPHWESVHIRYFAVRDEAGTYLGTLEVTQDLTRLRALEGEQRLLQYDNEKERPA